jgi:hypothetical protein
MATDGAGGLSTAAIERCIDNWETETQDGDEIPAARAELAALRAAVERHHKRADMLQGALEDAARHIGPPEDYSRSSDDGMWDLASRIAGVLQTFGESEIADGPGAAGARDETAAVVRRALVDWCAKYGTEVPAYDDEDAERLIDEWLPDWLDALRAGGAGGGDKEG